MKEEKLLDLIGEVDESLIARAGKDGHGKQKRGIIRTTRYIAVAASICVIGIGATMIIKNGGDQQNTLIQAVNTTPPDWTEKNQKEENKQNNVELKKLPIRFNYIGEQASNDDTGLYIIKDLKDIETKNPTRNQTERIKELTELPVFINDGQVITSAYEQGEEVIEKAIPYKNIKDLIYFKKPIGERQFDFNIYGERSSDRVAFSPEVNEERSLVEQLYDYTFHRVEFYEANTEEVKETGDKYYNERVIKPSKKDAVFYPIISLEEAQKKMREGTCYCYGGEKGYLKDATIKSVEIEYRLSEQAKYFIPYYVFTIVNDRWVNPVELPKDSAISQQSFTSASPIYVPAIKEEYLKISDPDWYYKEK